MIKFAVVKHPVILACLFVLSVLVVMDFVQRVWTGKQAVSSMDSDRVLDASLYTRQVGVLPKEVTAWLTKLDSERSSEHANNEVDEQTTSASNTFTPLPGSRTLGDLSLRLRGVFVYQDSETSSELALVEVQSTEGSNIGSVRLQIVRVDEELGGSRVTSISPGKVHFVTQQGESVEFLVFNPRPQSTDTVTLPEVKVQPDAMEETIDQPEDGFDLSELTEQEAEEFRQLLELRKTSRENGSEK